MRELTVGRYTLHAPLGFGGTATVHLGIGRGPAGFARPVAIKRLHPELAHRADSIVALFEEARLAARVQHANVVATLDVLVQGGEPLIVFELVRGVAWSRIWSERRRARRLVEPSVACAVVVGLLGGLEAVHRASDDAGESMGLVHRDVSPQNVVLGADGVVRLGDFGIARCFERDGARGPVPEGKLGYLAPEAWGGAPIDRRADVYACGVLLWEALTGERLFGGMDLALAPRRAGASVPRPIDRRPELGAELSGVVMKALSHRPEDRFATADEMGAALEAAHPVASARSLGRWVEAVAGAELRAQCEAIAAALASTPVDDPGLGALEEAWLARSPDAETFDEA
jgi:serine/threonine-protein kinase